MSNTKMQRVFVYGTLKQGFYFHEKYLGDGKAIFIGPARATTDYSLFVDGMPHMVREASETGVKGELYEVSQDVLNELDKLEGHPVVYFRDLVEVTLDVDVHSGQETKELLAWGYLRPKSFRGKAFAWKEEEFL